MHLRPFIRRARWVALVWVVALAAAAVNAYAGEWLLAAVALTLLGLSVYAEALHQRLVDAEAERDRYLEKAIAYRLRLSVRRPVARWED
jgi:general stress protein CsbA